MIYVRINEMRIEEFETINDLMASATRDVELTGAEVDELHYMRLEDYGHSLDRVARAIIDIGQRDWEVLSPENYLSVVERRHHIDEEWVEQITYGIEWEQARRLEAGEV